MGAGAKSMPEGTPDKEKLSNSPFHSKKCTKMPLAFTVSEQSSVKVFTYHNVA